MQSIDDILKLVSDKTGCDDVNPNSDIENDLGCYGDDFHELIDEYSKKFHVDMTSYLWYFHTSEKGNSIGGSFFKAPYERVNRIHVTPNLLLDFANKGKWDLQYPEHSIPKRRYDLLINIILLVGAAAFAIYHWFIK